MSKISKEPTNDFCPQTLFLYGTYKEDGTPNFGLFCWFSYCWDEEVGVMMCIGDEKLTKDRIKAGKVFSANLVTEKILPLADYLGNKSGYDEDKMNIDAKVGKGAVLDVPVLLDSPVNFELEVVKNIPLNDGEVFLCKIRNVLHDEELADESTSVSERLKKIAPISTTCSTYFSYSGESLGAWGEPMKKL
ncbi:MAG: flavin reductase family protein [Roseburia sp.]|nr:flavin reductase family protein [Roseburia sp.]MCM1243814.1 flavin reductase family protein [Roseburia sp.]